MLTRTILRFLRAPNQLARNPARRFFSTQKHPPAEQAQQKAPESPQSPQATAQSAEPARQSRQTEATRNYYKQIENQKFQDYTEDDEDQIPRSQFNYQQRKKYAESRKRKTQEEVEFEGLKENIEQEYIKEMNKQLDNQSVLLRFRKNVLEKSQDMPDSDYVMETIKEYDRKLQSVLGKGTKEQQIRNATKLAQKFMNEKEIFGTKNTDPILNDYAQYAPYKSGKIRIRDRRLTSGELNGPKYMQRSLKFLNSLGPQYAENQALDDLLSADHVSDPYTKKMTVADYGKLLDIQNETLWKWSKLQQPSIGEDEEMEEQQEDDDGMEEEAEGNDEFYDEEEDLDDFGNDEDMWADSMEDGLRMSPRACEKIYELYTEGWTVRDLSKRFGILPNRVKFIVWSRAQLYTEILPRMGFQHFLNCMEYENEYENEHGYIDYGLDLPEMAEDDNFVERIHCWNHKLVDISKENDVQRNERDQALEKLQKRTDFTKKYLLMDYGTYGKGSYLYFLRDWKRMKGKGSDMWHLSRSTFKKLYKDKGRNRYC